MFMFVMVIIVKIKNKIRFIINIKNVAFATRLKVNKVTLTVSKCVQ